ncbi:MAG: efflux RND transporter periplasmic adaptor subunit [Gammaproteobacteria bacterium]|nr:efflux RND transporter periplasmic adaptor subunit [Gammaproteobacteria bacterium]
MKKPMAIILICLAAFFAAIVAFKQFIHYEQKKFSTQFRNPIITISATSAVSSQWNDNINVVGSTRTVKGVNVTTELAGMITEIDFTPGADVKKGDVLVRLDIAPDVAKLHELQAQASLDKITYNRDKIQYGFGAVSKEQLDTDLANMQSTAATVEEQKATIDKKIIRAPFTGKLGISAVNPGQFIDSGATVVNLETLDPIYVDFYLPQQQIQDASVGLTVQVTADRLPGKIFSGKITTINPIVDTDVRNVEVEATLPNPNEVLLPGMFTNVTFNVGKPQAYITLPVMAVTFNPYGSLVYLLKKTNQLHDGKPVWQAEQQFVDTGESRGNQISILKGVKAGDVVVTSGQLKLKNDSLVVINNSVVPSNDANPKVAER